MFFALTQMNERISASDYTRIIPVSCPGCNEPVFLKKGPKIMAHFAHYAGAECHQFSEGETTQHLLGKQRLFEWLTKLNIPVEMEAWLPELKQRPDLLVTYQNRRIALEYQCSPIPFARLKERTDGYMSKGYEVYWICGMDYVPTTYTERIAAFRQKNNTLICLDSNQNTLHMYYDLHFDTRNRLQKKKFSLILSDLDFPSFETLFNKSQPYHPRKKAAMTYQNHLLLLKRKDAVHRDFLLDVYLGGHTVHSLPNYIFTTPSKTLEFCQPSYIWRYQLLTKFREYITLQDLKVFSQVIPQYDALYQHEPLDPLLEFITELEQAKVLKRMDDKSWQVQTKKSCLDFF